MAAERREQRWVEVGSRYFPFFRVTRETWDLGDGSPVVEALRLSGTPQSGGALPGQMSIAVEDLRELLRLYDEDPDSMQLGGGEVQVGRFNVSMPDELWERVGAVAPAGNRSFFIRSVLEAALEERPGPSRGTPAPSREAVGEMSSGGTLQRNGDDGEGQAGSIPATPADPVQQVRRRLSTLSPKAGVMPIPKGER